jgi:hypothetical protein
LIIDHKSAGQKCAEVTNVGSELLALSASIFVLRCLMHPDTANFDHPQPSGYGHFRQHFQKLPYQLFQ